MFYLCSIAALFAWHTVSHYASGSRPKLSSLSAQADPSATDRPLGGCQAGTRLEDREERHTVDISVQAAGKKLDKAKKISNIEKNTAMKNVLGLKKLNISKMKMFQ